MITADFNKVVEAQLDRIRHILVKKAVRLTAHDHLMIRTLEM